MTAGSRRYPTVVEVYASPELGVLALLEAAVDVALVALVAAHPDEEPDPGQVPVERRAAKSLIAAASALRTALDRDKLAIARARDRDVDDQLPFRANRMKGAALRAAPLVAMTSRRSACLMAINYPARTAIRHAARQQLTSRESRHRFEVEVCLVVNRVRNVIRAHREAFPLSHPAVGLERTRDNIS